MESSYSKTVLTQEQPRNRDAWWENEEVQEEMRKLKHWLGLERDWRIQLCKELGYKAKCSTEEERKNPCSRDFEEWQVALEKNIALLAEQEPLRASYQEMSEKYETDLQCELEKKIKSHANRLSQDRLLMQNMRAEPDECCQKMAEELLMQKEKNVVLQEELETLRASYQELSQRYETDLSTVMQRAEEFQREIEKEIESRSNTVSQDQLLTQREENMVLQEDLDTVRASYEDLSQRYETDLSTVMQKADNFERQLKKEMESNRNMVSQDQHLMQNEKNMVLKEELEKLRASYLELSQRYETDVITVSKQADDLEKENECHADTVRHLRAEKDALGEKMVKKITLLLQNAAEQEMLLRKELEELKSQLTTTVKAQREKNHPSQVELTSEVPDKTPTKTRKASPSPCKRVQQCLGMRKPQNRRTSKDSNTSD
ncbi:putative MAR-binding filament-like protein 1-1 [Scophthalmus maximus]|uniref:Putative MAR-binding filament-like protein 1-1 n=1 Tax=Scophthalmus maximus TaxID=52904 RepID=A0A2U9CXP9_SCOMX|nr:putative MAR-binding filament-like protein 1-1 [Scophthalmus maximus]KAF0024437.1 hypothetical protein F2P81_023239 [Scophthalmus maximus]